MPGRRGRNLRQGDLAEGLGLEWIRPFAAVARVPREEDIGFDAVCTLLRREGSLLMAEDSFLVQVKASSVRTIAYQDDDYRWLQQLRPPLFIASVDLSRSEVEVYTTQRGVDPVDASWSGVCMYLDSDEVGDGEDYDHGPDVRDGVHHVHLGPPVLRWTPSDMNDELARCTASEVMKAWIRWEERNYYLRGFGGCFVPKWRTGEPPRRQYYRFGQLDEEAVADAQLKLAYVLFATAPHCTSEERSSLLQALEVLRTRGVYGTELDLARQTLESS